MWRDLSNERKDLREKTEVLKGEGILPPGWQPWLSSLLTYGFRTCRPPLMGEPVPPGKPLRHLYCHCLVAESCPTLLQPQALQPARLPLSMGFPRQEHWSVLPFPPPRNLPDSGTETTSPALAGGVFTGEPPGKPLYASVYGFINPTTGSVSLENGD